MTNILVVLGSARKGRVADAILRQIEATAEHKDITLSIADLAEINLPYFDNERSPSDPEYAINNEPLEHWSEQVATADAVVLVMPEYNHSLSGILKNAIDSLYVEWNQKPVGVVTYGWYGGENALVTLREIATVIKIDLKDPAQLFFTKDLTPEGNPIDDEAINRKIEAVLSALTPNE